MQRPTKASKKYTVEAFRKVHGDLYDYSKYVYTGAEKLSTFICPVHGEFEQKPYNHLKGFGCQACGYEATAESKRREEKDYLAECARVHNNRYDYSKAVYTYAKQKITIICPVHGEFEQEADSHRAGKGCSKCADTERGMKRRSSTEEFIERAKEVHSGYDYSEVKYIKNYIPVTIICPDGHTFKQRPANHLNGYGCPICKISPVHRRLLDDLGGEANVRTVLPRRQEIDLLFPDERVGFEVNGVYYHSEAMVGQRRKGSVSFYHQNKTNAARKKGIDLYHIWLEKEYNYPLILSWVKAKLGRIENKIAARKTKVVEVPSGEYQEFLKRTHLQGSTNSSVRLGLEYKGALVSAIGFRKMKGDAWSLDRFSSELDTIVQGGFSKLLKHFIRTHAPAKIVTFSDDSYSKGGVYESNGFKRVSTTKQPRLFYTDGNVLYHRQRFQRKNIHRRRPDIPWGSERSMAEAEGFIPLWGCVTVRWELDPG